MGRYTGSAESQTAMAAGLPVTTTVNGYIGAMVAGASANFRLRRLRLGVRGPSGAPTSQQVAIGVYRQTARAAGTGLSTVTLNNTDTRGRASSITGFDVTTATTLGTNGPTIGAQMDEITFNTQSGYDIPYEVMDEWFVDQGTANGFAFVNLGQALPASHILTMAFTEEE